MQHFNLCHSCIQLTHICTAQSKDYLKDLSLVCRYSTSLVDKLNVMLKKDIYILFLRNYKHFYFEKVCCEINRYLFKYDSIRKINVGFCVI